MAELGGRLRFAALFSTGRKEGFLVPSDAEYAEAKAAIEAHSAHPSRSKKDGAFKGPVLPRIWLSEGRLRELLARR